jgi:hypothetical protein
MSFFKFLDLLIKVRGRVYELHILEIPYVVNLGFRSQLSRISQISASFGSPTAAFTARCLPNPPLRLYPAYHYY